MKFGQSQPEHEMGKSKRPKLVPHPESNELAKAMQDCLARAIPWSGSIFRSTSPEYANTTDLLSGVGSKSNGARYTPKGSFPTVYGSLDPDTAMHEALAFHRRAGIPVEQAMPRVFVSMRVALRRILPLTDRRTRALLRLSVRRLTRVRWQDEQDSGREALTQAVGRIARELGFEGLLVPSAQGAGQNLVLFPDRLLPGSRLEIINAGQLRRR
jgi:RES domain-containing protein